MDGLLFVTRGWFIVCHACMVFCLSTVDGLLFVYCGRYFVCLPVRNEGTYRIPTTYLVVRTSWCFVQIRIQNLTVRRSFMNQFLLLYRRCQRLSEEAYGSAGNWRCEKCGRSFVAKYVLTKHVSIFNHSLY